MKLLHVVATPRASTSNTLRLSESLLDALTLEHPDLTVEVLDLFSESLPAVAGDNMEAKYSLMVGQPIDRSHAKSWNQIECLIEQFMAADLYVISAPMWNLSIPYALKYYIDCIVQPGFLFRYSDEGRVVPLVLGKKMICVTSSGSDYSAPPMSAYDFHEPYLRAIFGFVGVSDIQFVKAGPMDITPNLRDAALSAAVQRARELAAAVGVAAR